MESHLNPRLFQRNAIRLGSDGTLDFRPDGSKMQPHSGTGLSDHGIDTVRLPTFLPPPPAVVRAGFSEKIAGS
jgi:hypothetical protein